MDTTSRTGIFDQSKSSDNWPSSCYKRRRSHVPNTTKMWGVMADKNEPSASIFPKILRDKINMVKGRWVVSVPSCLLILNSVSAAKLLGPSRCGSVLLLEKQIKQTIRSWRCCAEHSYQTIYRRPDQPQDTFLVLFIVGYYFQACNFLTGHYTAKVWEWLRSRWPPQTSMCDGKKSKKPLTKTDASTFERNNERLLPFHFTITDLSSWANIVWLTTI